MRNKKVLFIICLLTIFAVGMIVCFVIDKNHRIGFTVEKIDVTHLLTEEEMKEGKHMQIKEDETKNYVYISIGEQERLGKKDVNIDIVKIKETKDKINIYAKETGHCTFDYFLKQKILGFFYDRTDVSPIFYENKYQIISIEKKNKPIKVIWRKHLSC